ncbi:MAG: HD domain-containing protein, partial [Hamadaea sp.]|nr:HD domain-containing protein [Hamadaea sp.]
MDQGASLDSADQGSEEAGGPEKILRAATVALEVEGTHKGLQPIRGTGFIIAPGVVATCAHLFDGASSNVRGRTSHGRQIHLQVSQEAPRKESRDLDLVFLTGIDGESIALDYVLMDPYIDIGDRLWTFGHPANGYQRGQSANFTYQGGSRPDGTPDVELGRVFGTPVGPGYSGSAVLNLATGAVCGMLLTSDERGSAHMLPASEIIAAAGIYLGSLTSRSNLPWIESLSDEQLERGRWQYPPTSLRRYINSLKRYSDTHPYSFTPGPNRRPLPALSSVYVRQVAAAQTRPTSTGANRVMAADDLLHIDDDLCVTGPAGYGKSSLLRAVTRELAELPFTDVTKVPSCVMATDLVARQTVADALASSINAELSAYGLISPVSADVFSRPPWSGARWLILVDGLDEVASSTSRDAILKKLRALAESSPDVYQFMIATRPLEHEMASVQFYEALQIYELLPFNGEQVVTLAQSWLKALGAPDIDESTRRFEDAITMVGLGDLAQNPLMATMLLQLFLLDESKALPPGRYLVYQEYLATLRAQLFESSGRGLREQLLQTLRPFGSSAENAAEEILREADGWLCQLAYSRQRGISDQADLLLNEWTAALRPSTVPADLWKSMLREVLRRSGILVEHVEDFYFLHQTIQEFLAAQYAFSVSGLAEEEILEAISAERADVNGSNVVRQESYLRFLLAAALPYDNGVLNAIIDALMEDRFDVCDLVVTLASDGVVINERLAEETIRALSRLATSPSASISTIRAALDSIVKISDSSRAFFTFLDIVDDHAAPSKARELAIDALGEYCVDTGAGFPGRWRSLRALAETREPHTLDFLVRICKDSRFDVSDRVQAFEALVHIEDIARVKELVYLTVDDRLFAWQREHIASVLRTLPGVSLSYRQRVRVLWIGLRGRLSRFKARWQSTLVAEELVPLISEHRKWHPRADIRLLQQAYETADRWHSGQYRKSGDPYITHPLAVAGVLAGLGMDTTTLVAALLQDVAEDTAYTLDQVRADFGESVALLVDCATKFRKVRLRDTAKAEAIRKMVVATAKDPRVPVIVLADRLHNMRTLTYLSAISRERAAKETLEILAPLAHRLGMNTIKWELEDLAFE